MSAIPVWIVWALLGHLANGAAFVLDKTLLRKSFKRPATYSGLIGLLGFLALVLIPFGVHLPGPTGGIWIAVSGITFVVSLWLFFDALKSGEASRVVPIIGSLIPVLTLVGTSVFLGERFAGKTLLGFATLVLATIILSGAGSRAKGKLESRTLMIAGISALLFAVSSVTIKLAYDSDGFVTSFMFSRLIGIPTAFAILALDGKALLELKAAIFPTNQSGGKGRTAIVLVLVAQSLGAAGFVLVQYAISLGSAAIVNALQAIQYAFLVVIAFVFAKKAPDLLGEELTRSVMIRKLIAIGFVAIGLWLVV